MAAQAAARLSADVKVAMTGTPVENRLEELWSLFQVANPGVRRSAAAKTQSEWIPLHEIDGSTFYGS
ncbi:SNF2-related protein [Rhodococcus sp. IEGM 1379]|nr:SNF2-related protein [Rhodococcus sp. IEGM 1379]MDI9914735.1 SNF2-related protein [Rhodococcus sp. IEGM 1379]